MDFKEYLNEDKLPKEKLDEAVLNNWQSHLTEAVGNLDKAGTLSKGDKALMLAIKDLAKDVRVKTDNIKKRFK